MITKRITPDLPPMCVITGFLYEAEDPRELSEDMLEVELSNGLLITAGWYQGTPSGAYWVSIFRGCDEVVPAVNSNNAEQAAIDVQSFAEQFIYRNLSPTSDSVSTIDRIPN